MSVFLKAALYKGPFKQQLCNSVGEGLGTEALQQDLRDGAALYH